MDRKPFAELLESVRWAGKVVRGERVQGRATVALSAEDVRQIRERVGLTQEELARLVQVSVGTLRNWEQGRRLPTGPARALLTALKNDTAAVVKALTQPLPRERNARNGA